MKRAFQRFVLTLAVGATAAGAGSGCARYLKGNEPREPKSEVPASFGPAGEGASPAAQKTWDELFSDPDLKALIEEALQNNQELNIQVQEIIITQNEVAARRGEYVPSLDGKVGAGIEKVGQRTSQGVSDEAHGVPEHLPKFEFGFSASWEIDVWGKLRNAAKSADYRYLASIEARNFIVTEIVAQIAISYYELLALDNQLEILERNIELQQDALEIVKLKKAAARGTELGVQRFRAEVLKNQGRKYDLEQKRVEAENRINFLVGRYPQRVKRSPERFKSVKPTTVDTGLPSELLENRPDVRGAELELEGAKLDVKVAKARFYPAVSLEADVGYASFNARHLVATPESMLYNLAGNLTAPLLNLAAIKADYRSANAMQIQAVLNYERTILEAFTQVVNRLANVDNLEQQFERLSEQVETLADATEVSNILYRSGRADYMEVLMTRRDSLEAEMELVETRKDQMKAMVEVYQALGGGWKRSQPQ